jgi:hypothetical protein
VLFCVLLLSVNTVCAGSMMSFPEKATASITSIDTSSGLIFAKDSASGQVFQFKLTNPTLLRSLNVGQAIFVDIANKWVSLDGSRINGNIVSLGPADGVKAGGTKQFGPIDGAQSPGPAAGSKQFGPIDGAQSPGPAAGSKQFGPIDGAQSPGPAAGSKQFGPIDGAQSPGPAAGSKQFGPIDGAQSPGPAAGSKQFGPIDGAQAGGSKQFGPIDGAQAGGPAGGSKPFGPIDGAKQTGVSGQITSIDASRGLVFARDSQSGRSVQFRLANSSFFQSLSVGQPVIIEFAKQQVSLTLNGQLVTGSIVGAAQTATQK